MLRIGVLGAGHLGSIHIKLLTQIPDFELCGFYDPDQEKTNKVIKDYQLHAYQSVEELIQDVEVVDIVTPTLSHYDCAKQALKQSKHIFIEKPITQTPEQAEELVKLVEEANVKAQVGHVERFNPAFISANAYKLNPMFIESHRLAQFNKRGTDVSVILDLMIHDIDIVLSLVKSNIKYISASGVDVISENPDIASARIEFDNGCVANLTASRISLKQERKMRLFQKNAYVTIDFNNKQANVFTLKNSEEEAKQFPYSMEIDPGDGKAPKYITYETPEVEELNSIKMELETFAEAINENQKTKVTLEDGYHALNIAHKILNKVSLLKQEAKS